MASSSASPRLAIAGQASSAPGEPAAASRPLSAAPVVGSSGSALVAGDERFNQVYEQALLRKKLFKDYLSRHQVLEKFNRAMEAVYELEQLPEDPMPFIIEQLKAPPRHGGARPSSYRPPSAAPKRTY